MSTPSADKRPADDDNEIRDNNAQVARPAKRRARPQSFCPTELVTQLDLEDTSTQQKRNPSEYDLDLLNYHVRLQDFGAQLQKAASTVFPVGQSSRYKEVNVILLSWEDEDPELPISSETRKLSDTFANLYRYHVEAWEIPVVDSHNRLQVKILQFLWNSDPSHLKIVYYAGHGKISKQGQAVWTSRRNSQKERCPTVKWSGIQNSLEESQSDVLILLDCNASGVCTSEEGKGAVELIAASSSSNESSSSEGNARLSFTHALNAQLKLLSQTPCFTVGQLYNGLFTEVRSWKIEDPLQQKLPVHLVLSQVHDCPRSICLSKSNQVQDLSLATLNPVQAPSSSSSEVTRRPSSSSILSQDASASASSSITSVSPPPEYPRLLFSIRISEDVQPSDLSPDLFLEWLKTVPIKTSLIRVEAGFASDSTLVLFSISPSILGYLPSHPALTLLGTIKSRNIMPQPFPQTLPLTPPINTQQPNNQTKTESQNKMHPPPPPTKPDDPNPPKGGCRYIMFRTDARPMTCACQFFSPCPSTNTSSTSQVLCECGHKPCYHLATRNYTVYRQELEALTKKVFTLEQDVRQLKGAGRAFESRSVGFVIGGERDRGLGIEGRRGRGQDFYNFRGN